MKGRTNRQIRYCLRCELGQLDDGTIILPAQKRSIRCKHYGHIWTSFGLLPEKQRNKIKGIVTPCQTNSPVPDSAHSQPPKSATKDQGSLATHNHHPPKQTPPA